MCALFLMKLKICRPKRVLGYLKQAHTYGKEMGSNPKTYFSVVLVVIDFVHLSQ